MALARRSSNIPDVVDLAEAGVFLLVVSKAGSLNIVRANSWTRCLKNRLQRYDAMLDNLGSIPRGSRRVADLVEAPYSTVKHLLAGRVEKTLRPNRILTGEEEPSIKTRRRCQSSMAFSVDRTFHVLKSRFFVSKHSHRLLHQSVSVQATPIYAVQFCRLSQ